MPTASRSRCTGWCSGLFLPTLWRCPVKASIAIYARVSSERQVQQATIDSQLVALRARAEADGHRILAVDEYVDEGVSGATLVRPALERLRDRVAEGGIERLYVHGPDRLARRYALQAILLEEFAQHGVAVVFLHGGEARTPEERMLVQMQGMFAEYERAHIAERTRPHPQGACRAAERARAGPLRLRVHPQDRSGACRVSCSAPRGPRCARHLRLDRRGAGFDPGDRASPSRRRRGHAGGRHRVAAQHAPRHAEEPGVRRAGRVRAPGGSPPPATASIPARGSQGSAPGTNRLQAHAT